MPKEFDTNNMLGLARTSLDCPYKQVMIERTRGVLISSIVIEIWVHEVDVDQE